MLMKLPVHHLRKRQLYNKPIGRLCRGNDQLFDNFFNEVGDGSSRLDNFFFNSLADGFLKPNLDIRANDKEYTICIEIPGVEEHDIKLEITNNVLTISGKKKMEKEDTAKTYYCMERPYGPFKRVLSLPEDVDQEEVEATFENGVLNINMQRRVLPGSAKKQIYKK